MVRAAEGREAGEGAGERRRDRIPDEAPHRVTDIINLAAARDALDLLDGGGDVLSHVVDDVSWAAGAEMERAALAAQIEVEDVEPGSREVAGDAARRQVPRVTILREAVDQEHRRQRASGGISLHSAAVTARWGVALADHRQ
jgi:hypothetical protein